MCHYTMHLENIWYTCGSVMCKNWECHYVLSIRYHNTIQLELLHVHTKHACRAVNKAQMLICVIHQWTVTTWWKLHKLKDPIGGTGHCTIMLSWWVLLTPATVLTGLHRTVPDTPTVSPASLKTLQTSTVTKTLRMVPPDDAAESAGLTAPGSPYWSTQRTEAPYTDWCTEASDIWLAEMSNMKIFMSSGSQWTVVITLKGFPTNPLTMAQDLNTSLTF